MGPVSECLYPCTVGKVCGTEQECAALHQESHWLRVLIIVTLLVMSVGVIVSFSYKCGVSNTAYYLFCCCCCCRTLPDDVKAKPFRVPVYKKKSRFAPFFISRHDKEFMEEHGLDAVRETQSQCDTSMVDAHSPKNRISSASFFV
mmetsp:Transcript_28953/g.33999  ORF Transcript_28953/g.33999 Transcript_28953/m.33999 type:complete len:145 (+) Transcript_28953:849-1283(+)